MRDLEAELLNMVCTDVEIEPVLQDISGEQLGRGSNQTPDARLEEEAPLHEEGLGYRTRNFYTPYFHVNRRHGKRVLAIPFQTGTADLHQERRTLC